MRRLIAISGTTILLVASSASATTFTETRLIPPDAAPYKQFGFAVAISGDTALVGAEFDDEAGSSSGSAYLFDVASGAPLAKLTAADADADEYFGGALALSGTTAIIGASYDSDADEYAGSAYLFDVATRSQIAKLTASDAEFWGFFGTSVAISDSTAMVGAVGSSQAGTFSGAAYLFDSATGAQIAKLTASDAAPDDYFGTSVALAGDVAVVGAARSDGAGRDSGAAYLFDVATGTQIAKLAASDAAASDLFGQSLAIDGNTIIVGAPGTGATAPGAAYLFDATTGMQIAKLTAADPAGGAGFGYAVSISGNTAIVGARYDDHAGIESGAAYLFDIVTGAQIAKLTASNAAPYDYFGVGVGISGRTAIVGANGADGAGPYSGAAYLYSLDGQSAAVPLPSGLWLLGPACCLLLLWRRRFA